MDPWADTHMVLSSSQAESASDSTPQRQASIWSVACESNLVADEGKKSLEEYRKGGNRRATRVGEWNCGLTAQLKDGCVGEAVGGFQLSDEEYRELRTSTRCCAASR